MIFDKKLLKTVLVTALFSLCFGEKEKSLEKKLKSETPVGAETVHQGDGSFGEYYGNSLDSGKTYRLGGARFGRNFQYFNRGPPRRNSAAKTEIETLSTESGYYDEPVDTPVLQSQYLGTNIGGGHYAEGPHYERLNDDTEVETDETKGNSTVNSKPVAKQNGDDGQKKPESGNGNNGAGVLPPGGGVPVQQPVYYGNLNNPAYFQHQLGNPYVQQYVNPQQFLGQQQIPLGAFGNQHYRGNRLIGQLNSNQLQGYINQQPITSNYLNGNFRSQIPVTGLAQRYQNPVFSQPQLYLNQGTLGQVSPQPQYPRSSLNLNSAPNPYINQIGSGGYISVANDAYQRNGPQYQTQGGLTTVGQGQGPLYSSGINPFNPQQLGQVTPSSGLSAGGAAQGQQISPNGALRQQGQIINTGNPGLAPTPQINSVNSNLQYQQPLQPQQNLYPSNNLLPQQQYFPSNFNQAYESEFDPNYNAEGRVQSSNLAVAPQRSSLDEADSSTASTNLDAYVPQEFYEEVKTSSKCAFSIENGNSVDDEDCIEIK